MHDSDETQQTKAAVRTMALFAWLKWAKNTVSTELLQEKNTVSIEKRSRGQ